MKQSITKDDSPIPFSLQKKQSMLESPRHHRIISQDIIDNPEAFGQPQVEEISSDGQFEGGSRSRGRRMSTGQKPKKGRSLYR